MAAEEKETLIDGQGRPRFGIHAAPLASFNLEDYRPYGLQKSVSLKKRLILRYRIKRWEYLGVCNDDVIFGAAVINLGYMCNFFAYLFDRREKSLREYSIVRPGSGPADFEGTSLSGAVTFAAGNTSLSMISTPDTVVLEGSIGGELSINLLFRKYDEPLVCLTRVGLRGFNYTHKESGCPVQGEIVHRGRSLTIEPERSFGVCDFTLGHLARNTCWNWASGGGIDKDGNRVGFNCVQGY